jgi:hypothetical protein
MSVVACTIWHETKYELRCLAHARARTHTHARTHAHTHTHNIHTHRDTHTTYTHTHTYIHTQHIHTHNTFSHTTHAHTHTHTRVHAGSMQTFISSPVELLKIRLQLQRAKPGSAGYVGAVGMLRRVLTHEGVPGARLGPRRAGRATNHTCQRQPRGRGLHRPPWAARYEQRALSARATPTQGCSAGAGSPCCGTRPATACTL